MHLFLEGESAVDRLRSDLAGAKAAQWAELLPEIERRCVTPFAQPSNLHDMYDEQEKILANCDAGIHGAFGYLATRERRFFESAREHLMPMLSWPRWSLPLECRDGRRFSLRPARIVKAFAFFLDWCREAISGEERERIIQGLEKFGARAVIHDHEGQVGWYDEAGRVNNWVAVMNGSMGMAGLLLWRERPVFRTALGLCVRHVRHYLDWIREDGCTYEAGGYWCYGMTHLVMFLEALRVNREHVPPEVLETGACDWLERSDRLSRTAMFPLLGGVDGRFAMVFGDCDAVEMSHFMTPCALLARTFRDEAVQWHVGRMRCSDPLALLWYDPSLPVRAPEHGIIARILSIGWLLVRGSPSTDGGFFFALRGGDNAQTHSHRDLGSFILWYGGEGLIDDPGRPTYCREYWSGKGDTFYKKNSLGHNVVLVKGVGQAGGKTTRGEITEVSEGGETRKYMLDMCSPKNRIIRQRRSVAFDLRGEPVVVLEDDIEIGRKRRVEFRFHHRGDVRIEGNSAWITRPRAAVRMDFESSSVLVLRAVRHEEMDYLSVTPRLRAARHRLRAVMTCRKGRRDDL